VNVSSDADFKLMLESCGEQVKVFIQEAEPSVIPIQMTSNVTPTPEIKEESAEESDEVPNVTKEQPSEQVDLSKVNLPALLKERLLVLQDLRNVRLALQTMKAVMKNETMVAEELEKINQDRLNLKAKKDALRKRKDDLTAVIQKFREQRRVIKKEEDIDISILRPEMVDEVIKGVLAEMVPIINRRVMFKLKKLASVMKTDSVPKTSNVVKQVPDFLVDLSKL
jgi:hypothetical protein